MRKLSSLLIIAFVILILNSVVCAQKIPDVLAPDLVIVNGKVITVDEKFSFAESIAIKNGKILAVGSTKEIEALKGANTKILDLKGNIIMPGINDSHMHLPSFATSQPPYMLRITHPPVKSIEDIRKMVKEAAEQLPSGAWILGRGWNEGYIDEILADPDKRTMTKYDFDDITPNNPIYLTDYSGHNSIVNSKTLELAGITKNTADPDGGTIVKDPKTGEPNGFLMEKARNLVEKVKPPFTREEMMAAMLQNIKYFTELGITSLTLASETPANVRIYSEIAARGEYPARLNILFMWTAYGLGGSLDDFKEAMKYVGTTSNFGSEWIKVGGVKMFADGIPPTRTAWTYDPYPDGTHGALVTPGKTDAERQKSLEDMIKFCHDQGFQIGVHATGDRTMDVVVDAFVEALKANPWDARHYTIHGDWVRPEAMAKMAEYDIGHTTQTAIKYDIGDDMIRQVGEERAGNQWPLKEMVDAGVKVANSSDAPVVWPDWRVSLQTSILRESKATGAVSGPHQRLSLEEAIRSYTIIPAWLDHMEDVKGSIEVGKLADFCVLGHDITVIDPHEIINIPILMTILDGKIVYSNGALSTK